MTPATVRYITESEYEELEERSPERHEYFQGEMFAMAGGTMPHTELSLAAASELRARVDRGRCRVLTSDFRIRIAASGLQTYPGFSVVCGPPKYGSESRYCIENPVLIGEVLSPNTQIYDRGKKFDHYQRIPSVREYLLLSQNRVRAELFRRQPDGMWSASVAEGPDAVLTLESIAVTLRLADIYDGIELSGLS